MASRWIDTEVACDVVRTRCTSSSEALPPIDYDELFSPHGAFVCGTPQEAADKLLWLHERHGHDVHEFHADLGGMPWDVVRTTMELFASEVVPAFESASQGVGASPATPAAHASVVA